MNATKRIITGILSALFISIHVFAQNGTQTIKGTITDKQSKAILIGATVSVIGTTPVLGNAADENGKYKIENVPVGRYDLKVNYTGYKEIIIPNIQVTAGKEAVVDIEMEENLNELGQVEITGTKKNETNNELITVSGRSFSMDEVNRYAGGRSDPSRLASSFAGVSTPDDSRNDIVIRGNSPTGVLWRIDGLSIPNPNHFSTIGATGGPVSAINTNLLKNSDFFTSAFPAEYGNANAGVFDLGFRTGNSDKREHTIQFGAFTGLEAMTEGPMNKKTGSSYLIAYRYSFTGFAQAIGIPIGTTATPFYQDLSFKINGGDTKLGRFTLFGLGGKSKIDFYHDKIDSTDLFADPTRDRFFTSNIALVGMKHFIRVGEKSFFSTVIGATYAGSNYYEDTLGTANTDLIRTLENKVTQLRYSINTSFNSKISPRLFIKIGAIEELISLNLFYKNRITTGPWIQIWDYNDYTSLVQAYAHAKYSFNERLILNVGVHSQVLTLNNSFALEPRAGLKFLINAKNSVSLGYGMHSQMQPTDVYFVRTLNADGTYDQSNKELGFTKSQHFVLGYDVLPFPDWRVKAEVYYQMLNDVPVTIEPGSFSMLNTGADFSPEEQGFLVNEGSGTNYGIELTIEKFFSKGYYSLLTGSVYESKYKGSDGVERNTAFNGKFVYNILFGKEFKVGKEKRNSISFDIKMTQAGGRYFTPVDLEASQIAHEQVLMGSEYAYSERNPDFFRLDVKSGFTMNSKNKKLSQSLFFDIQNVTNNKNVFAQRYNPISGTINTAYQIGLFPNFVYKVQF
jgi:hypothetical protein